MDYHQLQTSKYQNGFEQRLMQLMYKEAAWAEAMEKSAVNPASLAEAFPIRQIMGLGKSVQGAKGTVGEAGASLRNLFRGGGTRATNAGLGELGGAIESPAARGAVGKMVAGGPKIGPATVPFGGVDPTRFRDLGILSPRTATDVPAMENFGKGFFKNKPSITPPAETPVPAAAAGGPKAPAPAPAAAEGTPKAPPVPTPEETAAAAGAPAPKPVESTVGSEASTVQPSGGPAMTRLQMAKDWMGNHPGTMGAVGGAAGQNLYDWNVNRVRRNRMANMGFGDRLGAALGMLVNPGAVANKAYGHSILGAI